MGMAELPPRAVGRGTVCVLGRDAGGYCGRGGAGRLCRDRGHSAELDAASRLSDKAIREATHLQPPDALVGIRTSQRSADIGGTRSDRCRSAQQAAARRWLESGVAWTLAAHRRNAAQHGERWVRNASHDLRLAAGRIGTHRAAREKGAPVACREPAKSNGTLANLVAE